MDARKVLGRIWFVLWKDDSWYSILISFVVAYLLIQYVLYPGLGLLLGTSYPVVAVISGSMEHHSELGCADYVNIAGKPGQYACADAKLTPMICGVKLNESGRIRFDEYWKLCGSWYENHAIGKAAFENYPLASGFNTGDIMVLRSPKNIQIGDVIVFESRTREPIIHRVIDIKQTDRGTVYETKGDHNAGQIVQYQNISLAGGIVRVPIIDETNVNAQTVVGKAWFKIPWLGYPKLWLSTLIGFVHR